MEYDYKIRGRVDKSEGLDVFDKLHLALRKQIVTVFSVYSYEFYYYEFDEYTKLETFQNWIARDTKIEIPSQILLADKTIWDPVRMGTMNKRKGVMPKIKAYTLDSKHIA